VVQGVPCGDWELGLGAERVGLTVWGVRVRSRSWQKDNDNKVFVSTVRGLPSGGWGLGFRVYPEHISNEAPLATLLPRLAEVGDDEEVRRLPLLLPSETRKTQTGFTIFT